MTPKLTSIYDMIQQAKCTPISDAVLALVEYIAALEFRLAEAESDAKADAKAGAVAAYRQAVRDNGGIPD